MNKTTYQLNLFWNVFASGTGLLVVFAFLVVLIAAMFFRNLKWWVIPAMLWTCTFALAKNDLFDTTLAFPMEQLRSYGRALTGGLLLVLIMPVVLSSRGWRSRLVLSSTIVAFIFQMVVSARLLAGGFTERGLVGGAILAGNFVVFGIGLSRWLQDWSDVQHILRCVAVGAMILVVGTLYQLAVNRHAIVLQDRMYCTTPNPQQAGMIIAASLPPICYLLVRRDGSKIWRLMLGATAGFLIVFLVWTGSRCGFLMTLIGLGLLFRARLGRMAAGLILVTVFALVAWQIFGENVQSAERLLSTEDTRSGVWRVLIREFTENPAIGILHEDINVKENSYLSTAARVGVVGLVPLSIAVILAAMAMFRLHQMRRTLGEHAVTADLVIAGLASLAAGSFFEGFLLGVLTHQIFMIYIYLAILGFLLDVARQPESAAFVEYEQPPEMAVLDPLC